MESFIRKQKPFMRTTMSSFIYHALFSLLLCFLLQEPTQAIKQSYIVYLGSHSFGPNPSPVDAESATNSHYALLGSYVGSIEKAKEAIFYSYNRYINGFAAILDEEDAAKIAKHPNVISVFLNKGQRLHTTHSWDFLGLERKIGGVGEASVWKKSLGEDIIIANLDTGVWPESKSFSDEGMGPVPKRWRGICQTDKKNSDKFHCNRKLIGARYFYKAYLAGGGNITNGTYNSARDYDGHGSHTLSTAGGNFVDGASVFGNGNGTASGGSPKARVATYKVCWRPLIFFGECFDADILAAFDAAISDGVDVLSVSLGGNSHEYFDSGLSIGSFHAVANGIVVVFSAGNSGPSPRTVENLEPWTLTVAASTIDREFNSYVTLGDRKIFKGASLSESGLPSHKFYPLISAIDARASNASDEDTLHCQYQALDPKKAKGKILACLRGKDEGIANKGVQAARAGAVGMILANDKDTRNDTQPQPHVLPASHVNFTDGSYIFTYINRTKFPVAYISKVKTELGIKPAPMMASFSSRGPNKIEAAILKPDITAPGVDIIAAYTEAISPTEGTYDKRRTPFITMSGTSMSCPHVSGLVVLLKSLHPDWSPAAIKSAIMTTARTKDNTGRPILDSSLEKATPLAYGAGLIRPNRAVDPGLIYDLNIIDYLNFLCGRGYNNSMIKLFYGKNYNCPESFNIADFNYPSITVPRLDIGYAVNVTRTLTNVGPPSIYRVRIKECPEVLVSVEPNILNFKESGEKKQFRVTLTLRPLKKYKTDYFFGGLDWTDGKHHVKSPIVVIKHPSK